MQENIFGDFALPPISVKPILNENFDLQSSITFFDSGSKQADTSEQVILKRKRIITTSDDEDDITEETKHIRVEGNDNGGTSINQVGANPSHQMYINPNNNGIEYVNQSNNNSEWLQKRNSSQITQQEREINIYNAKIQRSSNQKMAHSKQLQHVPSALDIRIPKKDYSQPIILINDDDSNDYSSNQKPKIPPVDFKSQVIHSSFLNGNVNDSKFRQITSLFENGANNTSHNRAIRLESRNSGASLNTMHIGDTISTRVPANYNYDNNVNINTNNNNNRANAKKKRIKLSDSEEEADSSDSDDSDNDEDEGGYRDEKLTKEDIKMQAKAILKNCEGVSLNLQKSIKQWDKNSDYSNKDCINLVSIANMDDDYHSDNNESEHVKGDDYHVRILQDKDIQEICPDLVLKNYQLVGVNWLKLLHENKVNGVLADDMGLGKTVQTIAFLAWLRLYSSITGKVNNKPHFIVVPASTLANWDNEIVKFCPSFVVLKYHGNQQERRDMRKLLKKSIDRGEVDIILSTYTLFERESGKEDRSFLCSLSFNYLVLDEAHCIKNANSSRYSNMNNLKTKHRLLLSGTPVQNNISELLALLSFLMPKVFGQHNCHILMTAFDWMKGGSVNNHNNSDDSTTLAQLRNMLSPFVLRRLKVDVLNQLTQKESNVLKLKMTDFQNSVYNSIIMNRAGKKSTINKTKSNEDIIDLVEVSDNDNNNHKSLKNVSKNSSNDNMVIDLVSPIVDFKSSKSLLELMPSDDDESYQKPKTLKKVPLTKTKNRTKENDDNNNNDDENNNFEIVNLISSHEKIELNQDEITNVFRKLNATDARHLFTALRKAANHPLLLRVRYQDEVVLNKIAHVAYFNGYFGNQCNLDRARAELDTMSDFDIHRLCLEYYEELGQYELNASVLYDSPKMQELKRLLPELMAQDHRMLIFSQWTKLLDLLEVLLHEMKIKFLRIDGSTPVGDRQDLIDEYSNDSTIPVFLLSTKAGGLGINLTSADTVIMHDLDFNPENDKQAEDRCHRIGQEKPVTVYKLVVDDSVDESIYDVGEQKKQLSEAILSDTRSNTKGNKHKSNANGNDNELHTIHSILQKALLKKISNE
eukprot:gene5994-8252_t